MSNIQVHLPDSLQKQLHALAERDGISIDQFIAAAQVPDVEPEPYDRLPQP